MRGLVPVEDAPDRLEIAHVELNQRVGRGDIAQQYGGPEIRADNQDTLAPQRLEQVRADHAGGAGNQDRAVEFGCHTRAAAPSTSRDQLYRAGAVLTR